MKGGRRKTYAVDGAYSSADQYRIPDEVWERMKTLLPPPKPHPLGCHNTPVDPRKAMDGIFYVLRTGCQWEALDATGICSHSSAHRWFLRWEEAGVFRELWKLALHDYAKANGIAWDWQSMDGAMTKAPLGGEKNGAESDRPGEERRQAQYAV